MTGGQEVAGSNPVAPTNKIKGSGVLEPPKFGQKTVLTTVLATVCPN